MLLIVLELYHRPGVERRQLFLRQGFAGEAGTEFGLGGRVLGQVPEGVLAGGFLIHYTLKVSSLIIT